MHREPDGGGQGSRNKAGQPRQFSARENQSEPDVKLTSQIADAPAPFRGHVRNSLAERHP
jgi:hypothetical protein